MRNALGASPVAMPSLRHLRLFETVGRLQSVRRASEECHLSQPAVTQAIAKLEEQIGVALLERGATGSRLNRFGEIFHRRAQRLFSQVEEALADLGVPTTTTELVKIANRITRSQIRSLAAIVENGSFAQAARALNVSQASLHRAARDLERNLQRPLYQRTLSGVIATPCAIDLARRLGLAMREIELAAAELREAEGGLGGRIAVGVLQLTGSFILPMVLNGFMAAHPDAQVRISVGSSEAMLSSLRAGKLDFVIGLLRNPMPEDLDCEGFLEAPYVVAARRGHPLVGRRRATHRELAHYEWVVGAPGSSRRACADRLFAGRQSPHAPVETYSLPAIRLLLAHSNRLTLLTSFELMNEDHLAEVPFALIEPVHSVGVTMRRNFLPTRLQTSFLESLRRDIRASREGGALLSRPGGGGASRAKRARSARPLKPRESARADV